MDVPDIINILDQKFAIAGAILHIPPIIDDDIGHHVCAVKINSSWETYDDKEKKNPKNKSNKALVAIDALMYVIAENS